MKMRGLNYTVFTIVFLLAAFITRAQEQHAFSVQECVDYAMQNSAHVRNALYDIELQKQVNREFTSAAFPQVTGTISVTDFIDLPTNLIPGEFFGQPAGTFVPVQFGTKYNSTYGADLQQLLFDGQVFVGLQARSTAIELATKAKEITEEQIRANVYKIYWQLAIGKKQVELIDVNIANTEKLYNDTKKIYENGFAEKLDLDKLIVSLSNLRAEKTKVINRLQTGNLGLKFLMGMPLKDELQLTEELTVEKIKENLLDESGFRYEDRKEFQLLQITQKLQNYNVRRYKIGYIPTLSLNASYARNAQRNRFDFLKSGEQWFTTTYIGLKLNIPIFDGFAKDARIKQAKIELRKTENNIEDMKRNIDNEREQAQVSIRNALLTMDEQRRNMDLAQKVYDQTVKKYGQGVGSNLEINTAQTELKAAQTNYFSALYDAVIARVDYLKATGRLQ